MDESDLREYVERSQRLLEQSPQMNEDNTKARLVEPLLELLGWDLRSLEVEREYSMQIGRGNARADYALLVESTPVVFVEAKGSDTTLSEADEAQLSSYMRQVGVDWGLLTNGKAFEVLRRRNHTKRPDEVSLGGFSLEELPEHETRIGLLSKESVQSGESDTIAERLETTRRAVRQLQDHKSDIAARVTRAITDAAGDEITQTVEPLSKEFVDSVVAELRSEVILEEPIARQETELKSAGNGDTVPEPETTTASDKLDEQRKKEPKRAENLSDGYLVWLSKNGSVTKEICGDTQSDAMTKAVDCLIEEHDLIERLDDLPYAPGKNAVLNDKPVHTNGKPMRSSQKTTSGYFVHTNLSSESKQRYLRHFARACDLTAEFSEKW